jgi:nitrite reductase/ring-hydroxylating ferredoxin subunit
VTASLPPVEALAGRVEEFPAGAVRLLVASGRRVAVGNAGGELFALDDTCLHRGGSLACGHLVGAVLACPMHWWRYDVRTGERLGRPGLRLRRYPIRVVDGEVRVTVPPAPPARSWREILLEHARGGPGGSRARPEPKQPAATQSRAVAPSEPSQARQAWRGPVKVRWALGLAVDDGGTR